MAIISGGGGGGASGPAGGDLSGIYPNPTLVAGAGLPTGWTESGSPAVVETPSGGRLSLGGAASGVLTLYDPSQSFSGGFICSIGAGDVEMLAYGDPTTGYFNFWASPDGTLSRPCFSIARPEYGNPWWAVINNGAEALYKLDTAPLDADIATSQRQQWYDDTAGAPKLRIKQKDSGGTLTERVAATLTTDGAMLTAPPASQSAALALGAAYQNTFGYDVLLVVFLSVTVNTSGVLKLGVGSTNTPTQQTLVTGVTSTGLWTVPIYLPTAYYALLSTTGTITVAVDGQIAMPV